MPVLNRSANGATELKRAGLVVVVGARRCSVTGITLKTITLKTIALKKIALKKIALFCVSSEYPLGR